MAIGEAAMKRVVVCCDGTWNDTDDQRTDTNVFRMARAIHATQETAGVQQIVLYLRGVGTSGLRIERLIEGGTGFGVDDNIRSAYMFIAQNYVPGDEIFLFGFSRGAFTARSVAGLISACGILKRQNLGDLPSAWAYYRTTGPRSPEDFLQKCNTDCHTGAKIKFLGVWDTVGALGIPGQLFSAENAAKFAFHNTGPCAAVKHGCHALAIDEHRHDFVPTLWTEPVPEGVEIEQVWFAGAHEDVGGGYVTRALADIPLVWMARKAEADGLALDWDCLPVPAGLQDLSASHNSSSGLFSFDRFSPTFREVLQKPFEVSAFERVYAPLDENGSRQATVKEAVHRSVVNRYRNLASVCTTDRDGTCGAETYLPRNLSPLFSDAGTLIEGTKVAE
jgi:uncharacterized protein (DUF2235 family)